MQCVTTFFSSTRSQIIKPLFLAECEEQIFWSGHEKSVSSLCIHVYPVCSWERSHISSLSGTFEWMVFLFSFGGRCDRSLEGTVSSFFLLRMSCVGYWALTSSGFRISPAPPPWGSRPAKACRLSWFIHKYTMQCSSKFDTHFISLCVTVIHVISPKTKVDTQHDGLETVRLLLIYGLFCRYLC